MIHHIEPRAGRGGRLALIVAWLAAIVVGGALVLEIIAPPSQPPPPGSPSVFAGVFGNGTANCPGGPQGARQKSCDIPLALNKGGWRATLTWDTADPIEFDLLDSGGHPVVAPISGRQGKLELNATIPLAATYTMRVIDVDGIGPINFSVGFSQSG